MSDSSSSGSWNRNLLVFSNKNHSASIADIANRKNSKEEYSRPEENEDEDEEKLKESEFVDRSAQLRASLNSLAMLNVVNVVKSNTKNNSKKIPIIKDLFKE